MKTIAKYKIKYIKNHLQTNNNTINNKNTSKNNKYKPNIITTKT